MAEEKKRRSAAGKKVNRKAAKRSKVCESPQCEEFALLLTEYWENREDQALRVEIEEHVRTCPACAEVFTDYSSAVSSCRLAARVSEPGATHRELWDRLSKQLSAYEQYLKRS